jgi:hypothetical protein
MFLVGLSVSLFAQENIWRIVEINDIFGDKTDKKRLVYQTTGTFSNSATQNSKLDVLLLVDNPKSVRIIAYKYGSSRVELDGGLFSYKVGTTTIEYVTIRGESAWLSKRESGSIQNGEAAALTNLLRQGQPIKIVVYKDGATYRFDVGTENYMKLSSEIFSGMGLILRCKYEVKDINNMPMTIDFDIIYNWTPDREALLYNNPRMKQVVEAYFFDMDFDYVRDNQSSYKREIEVDNESALPLFENIKELFPDLELEFRINDLLAFPAGR